MKAMIFACLGILGFVGTGHTEDAAVAQCMTMVLESYGVPLSVGRKYCACVEAKARGVSIRTPDGVEMYSAAAEACARELTNPSVTDAPKPALVPEPVVVDDRTICQAKGVDAVAACTRLISRLENEVREYRAILSHDDLNLEAIYGIEDDTKLLKETRKLLAEMRKLMKKQAAPTAAPASPPAAVAD